MNSKLSGLDLGRLRMSVGYGTNKKGRPLSPIEVAEQIRNAQQGGAELDTVAKEIRIDKTGLRRFLILLDLPDEIRHLVGWGGSESTIGFSAATEIARMSGAENKKTIAESALSNKLKGKEIRQVVQLFNRSGRTVEECLTEVLNMRPIIEKRYVFLGTINDESICTALSEMSQTQRDKILDSSIQRIGLREASGKLGEKFFTLVGHEQFNASMNAIGKERVEKQLRERIAESL